MICSNCGTQMDDHATFCANCGSPVGMAGGQGQEQTNFQQGQMNYQQGQMQMNYQPPFDPFDHTSEFEPKDISDNKVMAMLPYLLGLFGVVISLLATGESKYAYYHVRQALKFTVVETLTLLVSMILCWTIIVPLAAGIFLFVLWIIKIICFFQVCSGKAKEPAIIKSLSFLK